MLKLIASAIMFMSTGVFAQSLLSVPVRFETELSSEMFTKKHRDKFETPKAVVAHDITDASGNLLIREGSEVMISIDAKQRKNIARRGKVRFTLESVNDLNGNLIPLDTTFEITGRKKAGFVGNSFSKDITNHSNSSTYYGTIASQAGLAVGGGAALTAGGIAIVSGGLFLLANHISASASFSHVNKILYSTLATSIISAAAAVGAASVTLPTLVILAATKGKSAVIEAGTIWQAIIPAPQP